MKIRIFHANAGHGHRKVAEVIETVFHERGLSTAEVKAADALDWVPAFFGKTYPAIYFHAVKRIPKIWGWFYETSDHAGLYRYIRGLRSFWNRIMGRRLLREMTELNPDVIICTHFYAAELFATAKRRGKIKSKVITVVTDFFPHTFWVNEGTDIYWMMGEEGKKDVERRGVPPERVIAAGIPCDKLFQPRGHRREIQKRFGLSEHRLTLLLTSGSFGLGPHEKILDELETFKDQVQCFMVTGQNADLFRTLEAKTYGFPIRVFGFVDFMSDLMEASDLVVAKSGGSTTSESLTKGLPMIILDPIPGQETRNAKLLTERGAAFMMKSPSQIKPIVQTVLAQPGLLESKRAEMKKLARPHAAEDLVSFVLQSLTQKTEYEKRIGG
jgi:processive 1,2-diacylglycerol beta-glucosyltransferase